tara:strand:+ start:673 stop:2829 length:2157 start_codon:yes stop_codon:yes gene_type:complete
MSEESIDAVSQSLSTLSANLAQNQKILEKGSNTLVSWASSTGKAGQNWTTFSRLTSGTGIWKLQNYLRGTLEMIGKFSDSTKNQIKEQTENEKKLAQTVKGVEKIRLEYEVLEKVQTDYNERVAAKEFEMNQKIINQQKERQEELKFATEWRKNTIDDTREQMKIDMKAHNEQIAAHEEKMKKMEESHANAMKDGKVKQIHHNTFKRRKNKEKKKIEEIEALKTKLNKDGMKTIAESKSQIENLNRTHEETIATLEKQKGVVDLSKVAAAAWTDQQKEALESTNAYNQAIITGKSDVEAYAEGFKQLTKNVTQNQETFDKYKEKMTEALKIKEAFEEGGDLKVVEGIIETRIQEAKDAKEEDKKQDGPLTSLLKGTKKVFKSIATAEGIAKIRLKLQMKALAFQKFMKPVLNMAFKFLIFGILGMIALLAIAKVAYDIMGVMAEFGVFDDMKEIFLAAVDILTSVFGIIGSFMSGDFASMFDYLGTIMSSLMTIGWNLLQIFVKGIFAIAVGIFYSIIDMMIWLVDGGWKVALPALIKIGVTLLGLYFIKYLVMQGLLLLGIYALPLVLITLGAALLYAVLRHLYKNFKPVKRTVDFIGGLFSDLWGWLTGIWGSLKDGINAVLDFVGADPLATGGLTHGNTNLVGENGPERVKLPAGSRVYSNSQSRSMSNGSTVINNNITINAKDTSDQELRRIADKIGTMVNNKMNRTISSRTLG